MALTRNPTPHHVQFPRGVKCLDCEEFMPAELEYCIACGSSAITLIEDGEWEGGPPDPNHPWHVVEIACDGSGMVGYTRMSPAQIKQQKADDAKLREQLRAVLAEEGRDAAILLERAREDPAFAIVLKRLGIRVEG